MTEYKKLHKIFKRIGWEEVEGFSELHKILIIVALALLLAATAVGAVVSGTYPITPEDVFSTLLVHLGLGNPAEMQSLHSTIIWDIRIPRILLTVSVGGALAIAGAVFQSVFRNPLVEPYILGVSSGSAFGAALAIVYPSVFFSIQLSAFFFGALAVTLAYLLARVRGETPIVTLILAGVVIGSVFSAFVSLLKYFSNDTELREIVFWLMGGFYYATWEDVFLLSPAVIAAFLILWALAWKLNILSMGDEEARNLGINPELYKFVVIVVATGITAFSVSHVGIIAWVGLMMPHASRMALGPDNRFVIPASLMMGGIYVTICDTLARTMTGSEIPVGIITSILGAPYLCYLLRNRGRSIFG